MFKKFSKLILLLIFIFLPLGLFVWWKTAITPVDPKSEESVILVVPQGWGSSDIVKELKNQGLIRSGVAFHIMVIKQGLSNKLQAGDFRLSPSMNLREIVDSLSHGTLDVWVTIPEGLRKEEIVKIIIDSFKEQEVILDEEELLAQVEDSEGYLFPDTYLIPKDAEIDSIVRILQGTFEQKFDSLTLNTSLTEEQIVILASLVEREAKEDQDRALVAGILLKRLKKGWPLEVDAVAQYAKANENCQNQGLDCQWWPKVESEDLGADSVYNTYDNLGLPPTPICNPGLSSLEAAASPQTSDYWFYLSDDKAKMHFSETLEEHEENIEKYLQ